MQNQGLCSNSVLNFLKCSNPKIRLVVPYSQLLALLKNKEEPKLMTSYQVVTFAGKRKLQNRNVWPVIKYSFHEKFSSVNAKASTLFATALHASLPNQINYYVTKY